MGMIAKLITKIFDIGNQNLFRRIDELNVKLDMLSKQLDEQKPLLEFVKKQEYLEVHNGYQRHIEAVRKENRPVRVAFFVIQDSVFSMRRVFELMTEDDKFEPFIVVVPDLFHYNDKERLYYNYDSLKKQYPDFVRMSYVEETDSYIDFSNDIDFACMDNPYDMLVPEFYRISYFAKKGIPTFYTPYGYHASVWNSNNNTDSEEFRLLWRMFLPTKFDVMEFCEKNFLKGINTKSFGYQKMDSLQSVKKQSWKRKKIIISNHHTIIEDASDLSFSTFLNYYDFWLEIFRKYPEIDFVFRPHPLLPSQLERIGGWSKEQVDEYFLKVKKYPNVEYQTGGGYFETFVNSDALIHDCGSFMAEYLFTRHPACFLLKDEEQNNKNFNDFAKKCIDNHYKAFCKQDIIDFIDNVVVEEKDPMKEQREEFFQKYLRGGYPNVSKKIFDSLKNDISYKIPMSKHKKEQ